MGMGGRLGLICKYCRVTCNRLYRQSACIQFVGYETVFFGKYEQVLNPGNWINNSLTVSFPCFSLRAIEFFTNILLDY